MATYCFSKDTALVRFQFDPNKCLAAIGYLLQKAGGKSESSILIQALYLADRRALLLFGRTITGDQFVSLQKGPGLAMVAQLLESGKDEETAGFQEHFIRRGKESI